MRWEETREERTASAEASARAGRIERAELRASEVDEVERLRVIRHCGEGDVGLEGAVEIIRGRKERAGWECWRAKSPR